MSDLFETEVRSENLSAESFRIYDILMSAGDKAIDGGREGMVERMRKAFRSAADYNRAYIFERKEKYDPRSVSTLPGSGIPGSGIPSSGKLNNSFDVGVGIFECIPLVTHREYRVLVDVAKEYEGNSYEDEILNRVLSFAKEVAMRRNSSIIVDAVCKPFDEDLIRTYRDAGFVMSPGVNDENEESEKLEVVVLRRNISLTD